MNFPTRIDWAVLTLAVVNMVINLAERAIAADGLAAAWYYTCTAAWCWYVYLCVRRLTHE